MAFSLVQARTSTTQSGASGSTAFSSNVTAGNFLIAAGAIFASGGNPAVAPAISGGGMWTVAIINQLGAGSEQEWIAFCPNATGGATTVTYDPDGSGDFTYTISEWTGGQADAAAEDVNASSDPASSNAPSLASGVLGQADEVVIAVLCHNGTTTTLAAHGSSGVTNQLGESENNSTSQAHSVLYQIVSATTSVTAQWALGAARSTAIAIVSFKAAAGGGGGTTFAKTTGLPFGLAGGRGLAA